MALVPIAPDRGSPLYRFGWVCRRNAASRAKERREWWSVEEWTAFLKAANGCGMRFPSLAKMLERGACAEEIALEFGTDHAAARIKAQERINRDELDARRAEIRATTVPFGGKRRRVVGVGDLEGDADA